MSEFDEMVSLANRLLEQPYADPDSDELMLSRQFLRALERIERLKGRVAELVSACEYAAGSFAQVPSHHTVPPIVLHDCKEKLQMTIAKARDA